jgi:hypothetical protein
MADQIIDAVMAGSQPAVKSPVAQQIQQQIQQQIRAIVSGQRPEPRRHMRA